MGNKRPDRRVRLASRAFAALGLLTLGALTPARAEPTTWLFSGFVDGSTLTLGSAGLGDPVSGDIVFDPSTAPVTPGNFVLPSGRIDLTAGGVSLSTSGGLNARVSGTSFDPATGEPLPGKGNRLAFSGLVPSSAATTPPITNGLLTLSFAFNVPFDFNALPGTPPTASEKMLTLSSGIAGGAGFSATVTSLTVGSVAVPEPASFGLFGVGLIAMMGLRRLGRAATRT